MDHASISAAPTLSQFVAHVFFAQDLLHYEPLSAGIWYLAIDFQLFFCVVATAMLSRVWVDRCGAAGGPAGSLAGAAAPTLQILAVPAVMSLFWWNRNPSFDCWGFYYLSSYFLGMLVQGVISGSLRVVVLWGYLGLIVVAVAVDWRPRLLVAAGAALVILMASKLKQLPHWSGSRVVGYLGEISFSLFLIHFPACLLVNAWLTQWPLTPTEAFAGMVAAWGASLIFAVGFYHLVERPSWRRWRWSTTGGALSWLVREEAGKPPATLPGQPTQKE